MSVASAQVRIFVAEDNPADVYLIEQALRENNVSFDLHVAENGTEALAYLRRAGQTDEAPIPSLILLDLNLPQYDGTELLECIRQDEKLAGIPVVILTSSDSPRDRSMAMQRGASYYIRKPSTLREFMAIGAGLRKLLIGESLDPVSSPQ